MLSAGGGPSRSSAVVRDSPEERGGSGGASGSSESLSGLLEAAHRAAAPALGTLALALVRRRVQPGVPATLAAALRRAADLLDSAEERLR